LQKYWKFTNKNTKTKKNSTSDAAKLNLSRLYCRRIQKIKNQKIQQ